MCTEHFHLAQGPKLILAIQQRRNGPRLVQRNAPPDSGRRQGSQRTNMVAADPLATDVQ
jgi:hypothetical protein